jgi:hypothetical protein
MYSLVNQVVFFPPKDNLAGAYLLKKTFLCLTFLIIDFLFRKAYNTLLLYSFTNNPSMWLENLDLITVHIEKKKLISPTGEEKV